MQLLIQFLLRLTFGLAAGMAVTSSRQVTSGYFRNHLYVTLGLSTLAAMVSFAVAPEIFWYAAGACLASYLGAICWLYEKPVAGKIMLLMVILTSLAGLFGQLGHSLRHSPEGTELRTNYFPTIQPSERLTPEQAVQLSQRARWLTQASGFLKSASIITSGLLLGLTMAAMLLGHWYLNTPTMELTPLRRLILGMGLAVFLQAIVAGLGLWGEFQYASQISSQWWLFLVLRWSFGLLGVAALAWMAWETLKIPNTQRRDGNLVCRGDWHVCW